jgi:hypothetical protein
MAASSNSQTISNINFKGKIMENQPTIKNHVKFNNNRDNQYHYQQRRSNLNINHIKFDLLKISELYDNVLTKDLGHLPLDFYNQYLSDLVRDRMIYGYTIDEPEMRYHEASGDSSFTYTINIQPSADRASKALKIHVGLYKSAWCRETVHTADGACCIANRREQ